MSSRIPRPRSKDATLLPSMSGTIVFEKNKPTGEKGIGFAVPSDAVGIEVGIISHQAQSVDIAIKGFIMNLIASVVIVIAVLIAAQKGTSRVKAAVEVVEQTKWPLLGATIIAILSFAPIGASQDSSGEYCRSLFLVLMISLLMSWLLAITVTPVFASSFIKPQKAGTKEKDPYAGGFFRIYRAFLIQCIRHRWITSLVLFLMLVAAVIGFGKVKQNFFPDSTRPQFMVHLWMPQGTSIAATDRRLMQLESFARTLEGVKDVTALTGSRYFHDGAFDSDWSHRRTIGLCSGFREIVTSCVSDDQ